MCPILFGEKVLKTDLQLIRYKCSYRIKSYFAIVGDCAPVYPDRTFIFIKLFKVICLFLVQGMIGFCTSTGTSIVQKVFRINHLWFWGSPVKNILKTLLERKKNYTAFWTKIFLMSHSKEIFDKLTQSGKNHFLIFPPPPDH